MALVRPAGLTRESAEPAAPSLPLASGSQAFAAGALASGARFFAFDPASAESPAAAWLGPRAERFGAVLERSASAGEASLAALGAARAGLRAVCFSAGEGLSGAAEAAAQAAAAEVPLVLWASQRSALSPEASGQAGLGQMLGGPMSERPKAALAPWGSADAAKAAGEALGLADRWRLPVWVCGDLELDRRLESLDGLELGPKTVSGATVSSAKGLEKLTPLAAELEPPRLEGPAEAELTLVAWGSACAPMRALLAELNAGGRARLNFLPVRTVWPFPFREVSEVLYRARRVLVAEASAGAQLARLIRQETGYYAPQRWLKPEGGAFELGEARARVEEALRS